MPRIPLDRLDVPDWADDLKPLDQDRLAALAAEAADHGFAEPLHVVADGDRYHVVDGRHRALAAREAGWTEIDAVVHGEGDAGDALALAIALHDAEMTPETARRLSAWLSVHGASRVSPASAALDGRRRRLLRELLAFLHARKRVQDARLAQLFDLGDAAAAARLRVDERGLPPCDPLGLHEMPNAVALGVRELCAEGLLSREEIEHLFPLNERERLHLRAERALRSLTAGEAERVKLKGSRWGADYRSGGPHSLRVVAQWPDGRREEMDLDELPGLDRHTKGIIARAFVGLVAKGANR